MTTTPKPSQIVLMASGAVLFLFSFFAFYSGGGESENAWSGDVGTLFLATWPALFGLAVAGLVAATVFGNVALPDRVLTFTWSQVYFVLAFASFIILFGYLLGGGFPDLGGFAEGPDKGFGFFLMFLGSLGLLAGSVMELLGIEGSGSSGKQTSSGPPNPF